VVILIFPCLAFSSCFLSSLLLLPLLTWWRYAEQVTRWILVNVWGLGPHDPQNSPNDDDLVTFLTTTTWASAGLWYLEVLRNILLRNLLGEEFFFEYCDLSEAVGTWCLFLL
jgi:hypothetical protein